MQHLIFNAKKRLFVGDRVVIKPLSLQGYIQWVNDTEVSVKMDSAGYIVCKVNKVKKQNADRKSSTLYPLHTLKKIYNKMSFAEKVLFHYSRGLNVDAIAKKAAVSKSSIKALLKSEVNK